MLSLSLLLNTAVLIPICYLMITNNFRMVKTLGEFNPARGILLAMYTSILIASVYLLFAPDKKYIIALLSIQIVYKFLTPFTVKTIKHPFVISNILIALFHVLTIYNVG